MPVQEKAVGHDTNARERPILPYEGDKFGKLGVNGRLAPEQNKFLRNEPIAPRSHPAARRSQIQISNVAVVGIVRAAFTDEIAGMGHMQL